MSGTTVAFEEPVEWYCILCGADDPGDRTHLLPKCNCVCHTEEGVQ